jgi:Ca2+-binding EF-hand superfamily protein
MAEDGADMKKEGEDGEAKTELLSEDQKGEIKDIFEFFDKDKDGQIQSKELDVVLRALNLNPTESELKEMINEIDPTQTGFINLDSVYLIAERKMKDTDTLEELVEALKCFDGDKDGKITVTDFRYAMTALGEELDEEMVDDMIKEADNDNDGLIDIIEFAKICFNIKEKN